MSSDVNNWTGKGRLSADPEMKFTPNGQAVVSFSIACNERFLNKDSNEWEDRVEWVNLVAWGKEAEIINLSFAKGDMMRVTEAKFGTRSWDKTDGTKGYKSEMTVRKFEKIAPLTYPDASGNAATPATAKASAPAATRKPAPKPQDDDDVPF